jgi:hypothetical protein
MSKPTTPTEFVNRYLQAVRFWLPKTARQDDLIAELGEDLQSQIEARESELGRSLDKDEVSAILQRCGAPMVVAGRLGPQRFLIGPALFPIYTFVLKMVLLWIQVPVFLFIVGPTNVANSNGDWPTAIVDTMGELWSAIFVAAGIITLVFAILERTQAFASVACKWDPLKLPPVRKQQQRKPSLAESVCQLVFGVFGLVWLLLLPYAPWLILGPAAAFLKAAPMWHAFYLPIVLLSAASLLRPALTLAFPQWDWFPPVAELLQGVLSLILLNFILNASRASMAEGQGLLVLADFAKGSAQLIKVAAIVNVSILISLVGTWIGLSIAMIVHLWRLLMFVRKRVFGGGQPASLQLR